MLTGCCLRTAMEGSGHARILPTEYMVILLDEVMVHCIYVYEAVLLRAHKLAIYYFLGKVPLYKLHIQLAQSHSDFSCHGNRLGT
jgi:hypothetical protein